MQIGGLALASGGISEPHAYGIGGRSRARGGLRVTSRGTRRRTVAVDTAGNVADPGWLANAAHGPIVWNDDNSPETWSVTLPVDGGKASAVLGRPNDTNDWGIEAPYPELQLWRGNRLLSWGPAHTPRLDGDQLAVDGAGVGWYLNRRIGPGVRPNLLQTNEDHPLDGWWRYCTGAGFVTSPLSAAANIEQATAAGSGWTGPTMRFTSTLAAGPTDDFIDPVAVRFFRINAAAFAHTYTFSAWRWFESFDRPNMRQSGLGLAVLDVGWTNLYTDVRWAAWEYLSEKRSATPERATVSIEVPKSGVDLILAAIITAPRAVTHYWRPDLDCDVGLEFAGEDIADIAFKLSDHGTGNTASPYTYATKHPLHPWLTGPAGEIGKNDVNVDTYCPRTGITADHRFLFPSNTTCLDALNQVFTDDRGLRARHAYTATTRTFTYTAGQYRADCPIRYTPAAATVSGIAWSFEGDQGANAVHVLTAGESRASGSAIDASDFAGGLILDQVLTAPTDVADADLDTYAAARLARTRRPVTLACKLPADPYWTERGLTVGDRVPVTVIVGDLRLVGPMRITRLALTPDDHLELLLAPWPNGNT